MTWSRSVRTAMGRGMLLFVVAKGVDVIEKKNVR